MLPEATLSLGRLDGAASVLPNPDLFVAMYVRQEAVFSSQIEGTQTTLEELLEYEDDNSVPNPGDVSEVVNYVESMNYGLERLKDLPLSLRLIREIHEILMQGVRGGRKAPGEFRTTQNWIGPAGCRPETADFVPPTIPDMATALDNLEKFLHDSETLPPLLHVGIAHAQFETIHPFMDGNGRVGRLLITFLLCQRKILLRPLLYLSHYLKANRAEYYEWLMKVRLHGDWEGWLEFFLHGVIDVSTEATNTARSILELQEAHRKLVRVEVSSATNAMVLLDRLFRRPFITVNGAAEHMGCAYVTARDLIHRFEKLGLLKETTGNQRNKKYRYEPYLVLLRRYFRRGLVFKTTPSLF